MAGDNSVETNFISERRLELGPWPAFERAIASSFSTEASTMSQLLEAPETWGQTL